MPRHEIVTESKVPNFNNVWAISARRAWDFASSNSGKRTVGSLRSLVNSLKRWVEQWMNVDMMDNNVSRGQRNSDACLRSSASWARLLVRSSIKRLRKIKDFLFGKKIFGGYLLHWIFLGDNWWWTIWTTWIFVMSTS